MNKIIIEYDNSNLMGISNELYNLFKKNNYPVILLNNTISFTNKINELKNNTNYFLLSNKINNDNNSLEIIYPLKATDLLAKELFDKLNNVTLVNKYYQLRSENNTKNDYYELFQYLDKNGIIIKYGKNILNNKNIATIIFNVINSYLQDENIYYVKSGDSLYAIANKFNTSVTKLKRINNLTSNLLSINQKLIIPSTSTLNNNSNSNSNNNIYYVKSGDSLYAIANKFNTSVNEIKRINNLTSNLLSINQKLIIPNTSTLDNNSNNNIYYVKSGDSLYAIAKKYNTSVNEIKRINNLTSNLLSINQKLIIP